MTVPQCVNAPDDGWAHGANEWHIVVITVTIIVIVLGCAGVTPDWIITAATLVGVAAGAARR
ncbi:hypothetical protein [Streptomyces venezuelae]|uniref:hypothetical protein n=1 Tax=Streptomyces venezuelae TaxID=54571 RepID=UPI0012395345|nr:hypothetical protein [Streptomyces venezuelae]